MLQWSLLAAYFVSVAVRTLIRGRSVALFEIVQVAAALIIAFVGTSMLTQATGVLPAAIGVISLAIGAACYFVTFVFMEGRRDLERNLYFYSTLALVLVVAGLALVAREQWVAAVFAVLAVIAVGMWSRTGRLYLLLHGAAYVVAASFASQALRYGAWALAASPVGPWLLPSAVMLVMLVAGALSAWFAAARPDPDGGALASGLRLIIVVVLVWVACGAVIGVLAPAAAGLADRSVDLGALATLRTGVLAVAALADCVGRSSGTVPRVDVAGLSAPGRDRPEDGCAGLQVLATGDAVHRAGALRCRTHHRAAPAPWRRQSPRDLGHGSSSGGLIREIT